ncbi:hypothetical protein BHM03_00062916, partial [Ensete ventricosum]
MLSRSPPFLVVSNEEKTTTKKSSPCEILLIHGVVSRSSGHRRLRPSTKNATKKKLSCRLAAREQCRQRQETTRNIRYGARSRVSLDNGQSAFRSVGGPVIGTRTGRFRQKSTIDGRLKKKSTVGGRLRKKKRKKEEEKKKKKKRRRKNTLPARRPRPHAVAARYRFFSRTPTPAASAGRDRFFSRAPSPLAGRPRLRPLFLPREEMERLPARGERSRR